MSKNGDGRLYVYRGGQGEIIEKKSRFIANLFYVETPQEAENKIKQIKKKYAFICKVYRLEMLNMLIYIHDEGVNSRSCWRLF